MWLVHPDSAVMRLKSLRSNHMPYVLVSPATRAELDAVAEGRWTAIVADRPELDGAVGLQRKLIERVIDAAADAGRRPAAALVAARAGISPRSWPGACRRWPANRSRSPSRSSPRRSSACAAISPPAAQARRRNTFGPPSRTAVSMQGRCSRRRCRATRTRSAPERCIADSRPTLSGWSPSSPSVPFAYVLQRALFASAVCAGRPTPPGPIAAALDNWNHGYCPACGSWPAMAEVVDGHRVLRCSFCAAAWELTTYACVYCGEEGEPFVTAAPDEERKDRRVEVCSSCSGYLKTVDAFALSPVPAALDRRSRDDGSRHGRDGARIPPAAAQGIRHETIGIHEQAVGCAAR